VINTSLPSKANRKQAVPAKRRCRVCAPGEKIQPLLSGSFALVSSYPVATEQQVILGQRYALLT